MLLPNGDWTPAPDQYVENGNIVLPSPGPGHYRVMATITDMPFAFGEVYVFPNPVESQDDPILHVEIGQADSVSTRIYDAAGDLVHEARVDSQIVLVNGKSAYRHPLAIKRIKPGVYIGVVTATKNGKETVRKRYRFTKK